MKLAVWRAAADQDAGQVQNESGTGAEALGSGGFGNPDTAQGLATALDNVKAADGDKGVAVDALRKMVRERKANGCSDDNKGAWSASGGGVAEEALFAWQLARGRELTVRESSGN
ncbi:hypothetical protein JX265_000220 [Neoarthrinium moseri]|uniref:Uncharacterized protein n=1 Tax=Neoarthrinium moseri TaxID=1658444 RepID=A0A9P9WY12_9PEZI|nr:uncharacterized protein JN550_001080 [Neoarthrinium moseri]KAI1853281.1 hypothetical protein JX266_001987 [Neoarthrinium moseri]KAI1877008.1 hypothetical protein JN550_001080 [Neoarthrinium moseri]KAI1881394.1 hypothetical protein JX265_000220 [Neoarthrinium moseri]